MKDKKNLLFIAGTGRSGTHLIGRTISSHQEISGRIEIESTFRLITRIATTQDYKPSWQIFILKSILRRRLKNILKNSKIHILEKSHTSLWLVDFFIKEFNSKFIFVLRDVEPTVSSMLEHKGVLSWFDKLPLNKPNRFLGIDEHNATFFKEYSIEEKCSLRWKSHYETILRLNKKYPNNTFTIKYDDFMVDPAPIMKKLSLFIGVTNTFEFEKFKTDSLDKWKNKLTEEQLIRIREITLANKS
jgi:hypothetical protein|tara:strand:- start:41 stop:772 length:732 start_codon:yes stop_codon:yes gene_type:complete